MTRKDLLSWFLFTSSDAQTGKESKEGNVLPKGLGICVKPPACKCPNPSCRSISQGQSVNPETITLTHKGISRKSPSSSLEQSTWLLHKSREENSCSWRWAPQRAWETPQSKELLAKYGCDNPISQTLLCEQSTPTAHFLCSVLCCEGWLSPMRN